MSTAQKQESGSIAAAAGQPTISARPCIPGASECLIQTLTPDSAVEKAEQAESAGLDEIIRDLHSELRSARRGTECRHWPRDIPRLDLSTGCIVQWTNGQSGKVITMTDQTRADFKAEIMARRNRIMVKTEDLRRFAGVTYKVRPSLMEKLDRLLARDGSVDRTPVEVGRPYAIAIYRCTNDHVVPPVDGAWVLDPMIDAMQAFVERVVDYMLQDEPTELPDLPTYEHGPYPRANWTSFLFDIEEPTVAMIDGMLRIIEHIFKRIRVGVFEHHSTEWALVEAMSGLEIEADNDALPAPKTVHQKHRVIQLLQAQTRVYDCLEVLVDERPQDKLKVISAKLFDLDLDDKTRFEYTLTMAEGLASNARCYQHYPRWQDQQGAIDAHMDKVFDSLNGLDDYLSKLADFV